MLDISTLYVEFLSQAFPVLGNFFLSIKVYSKLFLSLKLDLFKPYLFELKLLDLAIKSTQILDQDAPKV